jgi:nitroimidazol reductase NimA-like FMN-containing flavoprotein (pyridoxamine 5'-phosphate oxidase superfamily)
MGGEMKFIGQTGSHFDLQAGQSRALLDSLLSRPLFAHLATGSELGPRESPVWFLWEDEAVWIIGNYKTDTFPARIEGEPRCALGIVDFDVKTGLVQHVGFRGRAHLLPHDRERLQRLLSRYLGPKTEDWDERFVEILGDEDYVFVRFEPETVVVRDQSYIVKGNTPARSDVEAGGSRPVAQ